MERLRRTLRHTQGISVGFRQEMVTLPNGKTSQRDYLIHPGAVGVLPILDRNHLVLVRQYRFPVRQHTWEIPAGKLDKGERPDVCVRRELQEETGYRARTWKNLLPFWPTAAFANEVIHLYVASRLTPGPQNLDEDEFVKIKVLSFREMDRWIRQGKIQDSKTIIAWLYWKTFR